MRHFIAKDDGNVVGKWVRNDKPTVPDDMSLTEVDSVGNYPLDYLYLDT